eukprot:1160610-Pelagomonas_calceolata.AAC.4
MDRAPQHKCGQSTTAQMWTEHRHPMDRAPQLLLDKAPAPTDHSTSALKHTNQHSLDRAPAIQPAIPASLLQGGSAPKPPHMIFSSEEPPATPSMMLDTETSPSFAP